MDKLGDYAWQQYIKRKQHYEKRYSLYAKISNVHLLPDDWLFASIDFAGDYFLNTPIITSGMGTKLGKIQYLIIVGRWIVDNELQQMAYNIFSDHTKKGWRSAIPALDWFVAGQKYQFEEWGRPLKLLVLSSDRGPHDFWCGPSHVYLSDVTKKHKVPIKHDTTAAGHSKYIHDQIIGTVKGFMDRSFDDGTLQIQEGVSKAKQLVEFCRANFTESQTGDLQRRYFVLPPHKIYTGDNPLSAPLDIGGRGIKSYHSALISTNGTIKYREVCCNCQQCINSRYTRLCNKTAFAGRYTRLSYMPPHPTFSQLRDNPIHDDQTNDSNHNNRRSHQ